MRLPMIAAALALLLSPVAHTQDPRNSNSDQLAGTFTDVTSSLGIQFEYLASHTPKKYLIETMGAGVALFDYDNDGRLDIFVVNGAPLLSADSRFNLFGRRQLQVGQESVRVVRR
jgi:enediyne biosynthesis protein E4